jgi:hypothetical protein
VRARILAVFLGLAGTMAQAGPCVGFWAANAKGEITAMAGHAPSCSTSLTLGSGNSEVCYWTFAYRSEHARAVFELLSKHLMSCTQQAASVEGGPVNHPDSFKQVTMTIEGREVSVSLKDKGGLNQTLVFLRRTLPVD